MLSAGLLAFACPNCRSLPGESRALSSGGREAQLILEKARDTLANQRVFAARRVGYGAQPTSGCWALTVLVKYDPNAKTTLTEIARFTTHPAVKLYALAGLMALDPAHDPDLKSLGIPASAHRRVECLDGCDGEVLPLSRAAARLRQSNPSNYIYETLPPLLATTDCQSLTGID